MKKFWLFILGLFSLLFAWNPTRANNEYEYTNLDITANILNDGTINFEEEFTTNFFVSKHWIIRDIPLNYSVWWKDFHIEVSNINVQWKFFTTNTNNENIEIKIWDADRTVIWKQDYPISYSTYGLIRNFSWMWYAELYWNLVGYEFDTNINKVRAELILPKTYTWFTKDNFLITTDWTTKTIDWFEWTVDWSRWNKIIITYDKWLPAYQGITLAIKFPNGYFEFDHDRQAELAWNIVNTLSYWEYERYWNNKNLLDLFKTIPALIKIILDWDSDSWALIVLLFILALFLLFFTPIIIILVILLKFLSKLFVNKWWIKKEFKEKYPVIIQYNPPKWLNSAEVWLLLHRYSNPKDTFSLVYKWAYEWIIEIQSWQENPDFSLIKTKDIPWDYPKYEKKLFNELFVEDELILNHEIYLYNKLTNSWIKDYCIDKWRLIKKETTWCNNIWCLYAMLVFIWTPILCIIFPPIGITFFLTLWCVWFFWWQKWRLQWKNLEETEEWAKLISHILWYEQFLKTCDENKLRLFLQQDPLYFDKILPYAVVFGLDTKLIKKIIPIMKEMNINPTRYYWDINSLSKVTNKINNMAYSHPQSSWWSSYSSSSWWDSGSSFDSGWNDFSSGWGGWWWGWKSW